MFRRLKIRKIKNKNCWIVTNVLSDIIKRGDGDKEWYELSVRMKNGSKQRSEKLIYDSLELISKIKKGSKIKRDE